MNKTKRPMINGVFSSVGLLVLYVITMTIFDGWLATIEQFRALWYLMVPLATGFDIQVALYSKLKTAMRKRPKGAFAVNEALI